MRVPVQQTNVFAREGEYWTVVFNGRVSRVRDAKGLQYLAHLLRHPGEEVHALALVSAIDLPAPAAGGGPTRLRDDGLTVAAGAGDAGPVLDATAVAAYRRRYQELQEELADAEEASDEVRLARAQDELDALAEQLTAGLGLGGRHRRAGSAGERARLAVTKAIRAGLRKLRAADPDLGRHLERAVRTGTFCSYLPDPGLSMEWRDRVEAEAAPHPAAPPRTPAPGPPPAGAPYVGRPLELGLVTELVAAAAASRGGLLLVSGEAGIGKTRLAQEARAQAEVRGMGAFVGRCLQGETTIPWLPLVEVLEQLVRRLSDGELLDLLGGAGPEVARVLPALRRRLPQLPAPVEVPAEQARQFLFGTLRDLLLRVGATRPALVVLEDVHWADPATLSMLEHLADGLEDARVLVVATYRPDEAGAGTPLGRALERLVRHPACATLALRPLDVVAIAELVEALSGRVPPPALASRLWADGDGNPFFVQELFKHLGAERRLYTDDGDFRPDVASQSLPLPDSLRLLLGQRLQRLSERCRGLLGLAAVVARDVDPDLLVAATEEDEDQVLGAVDEAVATGVLVTRQGPGGADRLGFSHALLREAVLDGLTGLRRRRLHLRVADALRARYGEEPEHAAEIADHLDQAGSRADPAVTVRFLALAADRSLQSAAYEDAARRFTRALDLVAAGDAVGRARLLAGLGYAHRGMARFDDATSTWLAALDLLEGEGTDVNLAAELCRALGRYLDATGGLEHAIAVIRRGLGMVGSAPSAERSWLQSALGYTLALTGAHIEAAGHVEEAATIAEELGDRRLGADVLASRTALEFASGRLRACIDSADAAQAALLGCGQVWDAIQAQVTTIWPRLWLGRIDDARRQVEAVLPLAQRVGHVAATFLARRSAGLLGVLADGDLDAFTARAEEDVDFCRRNRLRWLADAYVFAGLGRFWNGDWDGAGRHLEAASGAPVPPVYAGRYSATLLTFLAWRGDGPAFDRLLDQLRSEIAGLDLKESLGTLAVTLAEVEGQALLGRVDATAALYPDVLAQMEAGVALRPPDLRIVAALAGLAAGAAGDREAAATHFREARRLVATLPHRRQAPDVDVLEALARQVLDPGDGAARSLLTRAVDGYEALGMGGHRAWARAALGSGRRR